MRYYLKFLHGGKMNDPMATKTARMEMEEQHTKIPAVAAAVLVVVDGGGAIVLIVSTKYYAVLVQQHPLL
jgi:hypothetical protein